ncbi:peroxisome assembly protein (Peroxin-2) [Rhizophlyctis rosea]|uniref:RING-type E3 ubiquitin transferase (cysteine targeting) n=1 Tax=Rhizophlyctis rosea TaxID=64517 RepID=A0AAD5S9R2_9FUNG|nr:peroxisome assembly protein (Peroxin-2) [Rhizophlyctis rosea]
MANLQEAPSEVPAPSTQPSPANTPTQPPPKPPSPPLRILRVSQLDAELLDGELTGLLKEQFLKIFSFFRPTIKETYDPEITALLTYLISQVTLYASGASYGLELQNLRYRNERRHLGDRETASINAPLTRWQKIAHAVIHIGGRWGWLRLNRFATSHEWSEHPAVSSVSTVYFPQRDADPPKKHDMRYRIWKLLQKAETIFRSLSLLNFLVFLYNGKYRSVLDRILRMRLVYAKPEMSRQVSFDFMNRELVWTAFTEFLLFLMPLINLSQLKAAFNRMVRVQSNISLPEDICGICYGTENDGDAGGVVTPASTGGTVQMPYETSCGHVFCYYCLK